MEYNKIPLVFNNSINTSNIKNVILIDSTVNEAELFYNSVNSNTFPIIYSYYSNREELINLLTNKFTNIERIGFVMHNASFPYKKFINNEQFFVNTDFDSVQKSNNFTFLVNIIKQFNITNLDNLACTSLLDEKWKEFYQLLNFETGVIIGASNDNTGNIKYGGDWILESSGEDIQNIYWNENILNYTSKLAVTQLSLNGGLLYLKQVNSYIEYSTDNTNWSSIGTNWPVEVSNSDPKSSNVLYVVLTQNLLINNTTTGVGVNGYISVKSNWITIEGNNRTVTIKDISSSPAYPGFINNGTVNNNDQKSYVFVKNMGVLSDNSYLASGSGWIGQSHFGNNTCEIRNCYSNGQIDSSCGGIVGFNSGVNAVKCYSTGNIGRQFGDKQSAGGIFGEACSGNATYCYSTGLSYASGGIYGYGSTGHATYCYSTGNMSSYSGGIYTRNCTGNATYCYSTGTISGAIQGGGIYGSNSSGIASNCYSSGLTTANNGIYPSDGTYPTPVNCYIANRNWSDTAAIAALVNGVPTYNGSGNVTAQGTIWIDTDNSNLIATPFVLKVFELSPTEFSQYGGTVYLRQTTTSSYLELSCDNINWKLIKKNWPIEITNSIPNSSNILTLLFSTNVTLNNLTTGNLANCYFKIKSQYITIDGANKILTINEPAFLNSNNSIYYTSFPGLVLNGGAEGYSDITVQNIAVLTDPAPNSATDITLLGTSGWICQANFAQVNGVERTNCFVNSCYSNGNIDASGGGIVGGGSSGTVYNCYSTGSMMNYAGGIFGTYSYNNARAIKCYSTGTMGRASGGIFGGGCHGSAEYCYSTGNIGLDAGGIFGSESGNDHNSYKGAAVAINCYSTGLIGTQGGGIYGARSNVFAINCYSRGNINTGAGGIAGWQSSGTTINCYSIGDIELAGGGIFGMDSGIIKIKNCYTSGKLKYSIDISEKYKGGLIGWVDNTFFINNYNSTTVENSFAENSTFYDVNNLTSTNNNGWSDANAQTYLLVNLVGSEWISNTPNTPFTFSTPDNSRTLSNFSYTSPVPFNGQPVTPSTFPVSSTGTGTIKYFSSNPYVATVNNSTGTFTTTGSGDTKLIAILSADNGYRAYSKYFALTVNNAILKNGNTNAPEGYYYITNSDNLAIQNKTIFVNSSGFIKIIYDNNVWCSNSKKIYINNSELNLGQNFGSIILASNGVKYSLDGNTWN
jgi:hypothetical protein